jgi:hypothetical protein
MAIKFTCSCGKRLRARDEMAARRSVCPRCGAPVGIPSMRPTHAGTAAAPLTPAERLRLRRNAPRKDDPADPAAITAVLPAGPTPLRPDAATAAPESPRPRRRPHLEKHWYQCLSYPLLVSPLLFVLAAVLTALTAFASAVLPQLCNNPDVTWRQWTVCWPVALIALVVIACTCAALQGPLTTALAGRPPHYWAVIRWPIRDLLFGLKSCLRWLICFVAGPALLAGIAFYYWLDGGDLIALDWIILAELGVLTVGWWLLAIVATSEGGRLRDANPVRIGRLLYGLGYRAVFPALVVPLLVLAHAVAAVTAVAWLRAGDFFAGLVLACCWGSALGGVAFFFRLLGVWCYRLPRETAAASPQETDPNG